MKGCVCVCVYSILVDLFEITQAESEQRLLALSASKGQSALISSAGPSHSLISCMRPVLAALRLNIGNELTKALVSGLTTLHTVSAMQVRGLPPDFAYITGPCSYMTFNQTLRSMDCCKTHKGTTTHLLQVPHSASHLRQELPLSLSSPSCHGGMCRRGPASCPWPTHMQCTRST